MFTRIKMIFLVAVAVAVLATSLNSASAGIIHASSGNTQETGTGAPGVTVVDGTVNFAVFNKTGGSAGDVWNTGLAGFDAAFTQGTGSAVLDTTVGYLYVYQIVNDGATTVAISAFSQSTGNSVTSYGLWAGKGLSDGSGAVSDSNPFGTPSGFASPGNSSTGNNDGIGTVVVNGSVGGPDTVTFDGTNFRANWAANLLGGASGSLIGFTSNLAPGQSVHTVFDTGTSSFGYAASPIPEPSTLVLLGIGAMCGIPGLRRRMKKQTVA
jgi:hypothetical protein